MVISKTERSLNKRLKSLGLPRKIASSSGSRELTQREKRFYIQKTIKWKRDFLKHGKVIGKKTVLFKGRKYTREGTLL